MAKLDYVSLHWGLPRCPLKETCSYSNLADIKRSVPQLVLNEKLHTWIAARHFSVTRYLIHLCGLYVCGLMCQTWRKANPSWFGVCASKELAPGLSRWQSLESSRGLSGGTEDFQANDRQSGITKETFWTEPTASGALLFLYHVFIYCLDSTYLTLTVCPASSLVRW